MLATGPANRASWPGRNNMKGEIVYLYAFDVANEIITSRVREILSEKPFPFEIRMDRTLPKDIPLYKPLAIEPSALPAQLNGALVRPLSLPQNLSRLTPNCRPSNHCPQGNLENGFPQSGRTFIASWQSPARNLTAKVLRCFNSHLPSMPSYES